MPARDYRHWPITEAFRRLLLRAIFGKRTYEYLVKTLAWDPRIKSARMVDIVVRKDGMERRIEADWLKRLAIMCWPDIQRERARIDTIRTKGGGPNSIQRTDSYYQELLDQLGKTDLDEGETNV